MIDDTEAVEIAGRWCKAKGAGWSVQEQLGRGGTAPVFAVSSPGGNVALKLYDAKFSVGRQGEIELQRIQKQVQIGTHDCPSLVQILDGGRFEERLFLVMNRAPGVELAGYIQEVPRHKIRHIVDQVARAVVFLRKIGICHRDIKAENIYISADFDTITLLDLSVTRDIYDPIGIGTDHNDQLPVVATARYSPPEYLFRLVEPGLSLWHALDIYQLGALLRDLIMRSQLFEEEYAKSKENRYRFAWLVATVDPACEAADVDGDLVFLARRALDKDWQTRSALRIEDFLADSEQQRANALQVFGVGILTPQFGGPASSIDVPGLLLRFRKITESVDDSFTERLRTLGVTAFHSATRGSSDREQIVCWQWQASDSKQDVSLEFQVTLRASFVLKDTASGGKVLCALVLSSSNNEIGAESSMNLPPVPIGASTEGSIVELIEHALGELARQAIKGER